MYLIGSEFDIYTDNKAVQMMLSNPHSRPSARVRRMVLRMLPYKFVIHHIDGKGNIADYLSRNPIVSNCCEHEKLIEEFLYSVTTESLPQAISRKTMIRATAQDPELNAVIRNLADGTPFCKSSVFQQLLPE